MMRWLTFLFILTAYVPAAEANWWWPFSDDEDEWVRMSTREQDAIAAPLMSRALDHRQAGREGSALDLYKDVWKKTPGSRFAPEALYQAGLIHIEDRDWRPAFDAFQRIIAFYPDFPQFNQIIDRQFFVATSLAEGLGVRYLWIIPFRNYDRAIRYYEQIIINAPYSDYSPLALMNIAQIHRFRGDIPEAVDALDRLINNYPTSLLASDAYLFLAQTYASLVEGPYYDQGATREAISYYRDYLILFPEDANVAEGESGLNEMEEVFASSKFVLGQYYYRYRGNLRAAKIFLNDTITAAPESDAASRARELLERIEEIEAALPPENQGRIVRKGFWQTIQFWRDDEPEDSQEAIEEALDAAPPPQEPPTQPGDINE